ncbi:hypothetical protein L3X38_010769 [Prunus dulcis]|uniref:Uncharacterized protein n=1 Tax=Prunus dulcis TaxID=3755 RepID=A0AAD4ZF23_PRUDU|nr:hypothetical protein L3X38_010769 [Prunus dulcis]
MARPLFESNLVIREGKKRRSYRKASDTGVVPAEGSPMPKEVKVGALHKVPMWDFVQAVVVATRVLEIRFGIWELRQVSGTLEECLPSAWEKAWLPWC